jgi:hypothetical protein
LQASFAETANSGRKKYTAKSAAKLDMTQTVMVYAATEVDLISALKANLCVP